MDHQQASLLLSDLREGRLDHRMAADVEAHLAECQECREWSETYGLFSETLEEEDDDKAEDHPSSEEIARFAIEPETLADQDLSRIALHLRACKRCATELDTTREAVAASRVESIAHPPSPRAWWTPANPNFRAAVAAVIVLAALVYPAYLGLYRLPQATDRVHGVQSERDRLETDNRSLRDELERAGSWSGPVGYLLLAGTMRGEGPVETLRLRPGQPHVSIAVRPDLPTGTPADASLTLEIRAVNDQAVWRAEMSAGEMQSDLAEFEVVFLQIPAAILPPGSYELRLFRSSAPDDLLLQAPFRIDPAS